jgi:hypothetical protein
MIELTYRADIEKQKDALKEKKDKAEELFDSMESEIEDLERIKIGEAFGISKEDMFEEVRDDGCKETIGMYDLTAKHCQKLVDNEDATEYVLTDRSRELTDRNIAIYSGARPKKGTYNHKGIKVEFDIWKAPNGLWFGDHAATSYHNGGSSRAVVLDDAECAFETQKEVFEYCVSRALSALADDWVNNLPPEEIEVTCPDCIEWAKKHIEVTSHWSSHGKIPEMWVQDKEYKQAESRIVGCDLDKDGDPIVGVCNTCDYERPTSPWFGVKSMGRNSNIITREETPEETEERIAIKRSTPKWGKQQADANKLIEKLRAMLNPPPKEKEKKFTKHDAAQLELAL